MMDEAALQRSAGAGEKKPGHAAPVHATASEAHSRISSAIIFTGALP
jgi:hypothetical protein